MRMDNQGMPIACQRDSARGGASETLMVMLSMLAWFQFSRLLWTLSYKARKLAATMSRSPGQGSGITEATTRN
jgi:hypothetical protein